MWKHFCARCVHKACPDRYPRLVTVGLRSATARTPCGRRNLALLCKSGGSLHSKRRSCTRNSRYTIFAKSSDYYSISRHTRNQPSDITAQQCSCKSNPTHRTCVVRVPALCWEASISRLPRPHQRPCPLHEQNHLVCRLLGG